MSKIVPKSMQSQSSQDIKTKQNRNENTESDVMFSALFGGATGETSSEDSLIGKASMTTVVSADFGDENSFDEQKNYDPMALMASLQVGHGLGQKVTEPQDDALNNELPQDDKKSAVETAIVESILKKMHGRPRWIPHNKNPADGLTKLKGAHMEPMMTLLKTGMYHLNVENAELELALDCVVEVKHDGESEADLQQA